MNLNADFKDLYIESFEANPRAEFLVFIDADQRTTSYSREEFHNLVIQASDKVQSFTPDLVVIKSKNNPRSLALIVAALLVGKKVFPMSPDISESEMRSFLNEINFSALVFDGNEYTSLPVRNSSSAKNDKLKLAASFFILTSGTTGRTKIVCQSMQSVLSNIKSLIELHNLEKGKTIATPLPTYHVNALHFSFFSTLLSNGRLILFETFSPDGLNQAINKYKPSIISLVPSILNSFTDWSINQKVKKLEGVEYILTAAAPLPQDTYLKARKFLDCKILQGFGLSEAVNFSTTMNPYLENDEIDLLMLSRDRTCIGQELSCNQVHILDAAGKECLELELGELAIQGLNVMAGYLNSIPNEVIREEPFRTGDLGYFSYSKNKQKNFYITSRKKEIIKKNGLSISLVEIDEEILKLLVNEEQAIALKLESELFGESLAIVFNASVDLIRANEIREKLSAYLPDFKKPSLYICSQKNIRSPSGKALRMNFESLLLKFKSQIFPKNGIIISEEDYLK